MSAALTQPVGGRALGYAEKSDADVTALGDVAGMTITFTTDGRPFEVWYDGVLKGSLAGTVTFLQLFQGASKVDEKPAAAGAANWEIPVTGRRMFSLPAGTYTYKLTLANFGGGTSTVLANASNPLKLGANYR